MNYLDYKGGEHKYMFHRDNLLAILRLRGFESVKARAFDAEVDLPECNHLSLHALALTD
ncbi:MAG: hypothetical protein AB3N15_03720 [Paracoccaceae bacterium]